MKLSKVYSNKDFKNIEFNEGFNVVLGKIYSKYEKDKDTHNLGKTILIDVIDFLMLKTFKSKSNFLSNEIFSDYTFFIEILLNDGNFLVLKRAVNKPSKISFKRNNFKLNDFKTDLDWDVVDESFDKARNRLDKFLGFDVLPPWAFRKTINYFLRTQGDFLDVFELNKFKGKHVDWKPAVYELLGYNSELVKRKYKLDEKIEELKRGKKTIEDQFQIDSNQRDKISGAIDIKLDEKNSAEKQIDKFNFYEKDKNLHRELVEDIDVQLQILNSEKYNLQHEIDNINSSMQSGPDSVDLKELRSIYGDVEVYFPDNLSKDFEQLLKFNKSIAQERNKILNENLKQAKIGKNKVNNQLKELENKKEEILSFLTEKDSYGKFKSYQKQLAKIESEVLLLKEKLKSIDKTLNINGEIKKFEVQLDEKKMEIGQQIKEQKHAPIRKKFHQIILRILSTSALIAINQNRNGNVEFEAEFQNPEDLSRNSQGRGWSYKKVLCMAFDLAVLIHYSNQSFFKFVYHDGALESMDDRKKIKFIDFARETCREFDIQYIFTLIDSNLPKDEMDNTIKFDTKDICLELSDKDDSERLFKMSF